MLRSYITSAIRSLLRNRIFSTINLAGLTIGVAAFSLIALYVYHELSYDRNHEKADRIYRVVANLKTENELLHQATTSLPVGPTFLAEFPEVEDYVRIADRKAIVHKGDKSFYENNLDGPTQASSGFSISRWQKLILAQLFRSPIHWC